jgi:hypothetical protein
MILQTCFMEVRGLGNVVVQLEVHVMIVVAAWRSSGQKQEHGDQPNVFYCVLVEYTSQNCMCDL